MSFTFLPHTADLRAEVTGSDIAALYQSAVDLVRNIVVGSSPVGAATERGVDIPPGPEAERFFAFVRELVFLIDSEGFLPGRVTMEEDQVRLVGDVFDPARHHLERQIKAVTRHGYRFEHDRHHLRAELVFDL